MYDFISTMRDRIIAKVAIINLNPNENGDELTNLLLLERLPATT